MILPIVAYGDPVLRKKGELVKPDHPGLKQLIENMFETLAEADGIGLAAQQVGQNLMLFITDASVLGEKFSDFRKVFINPEVLEEFGDEWEKDEGCLSIPGIFEFVSRPSRLRIRYQDEHFVTHEEEYDGMKARIIQHEYDHNNGVLFIDHLGALKKQLIKGKLADISKGKADVSYRMRFPQQRRGR